MEEITNFTVDATGSVVAQPALFIVGGLLLLATIVVLFTKAFKYAPWFGVSGVIFLAIGTGVYNGYLDQVRNAGMLAATEAGVKNVEFIQERSGPKYLIGTYNGEDFLGTIEPYGDKQYGVIKWDSMRQLIDYYKGCTKWINSSSPTKLCSP